MIPFICLFLPAFISIAVLNSLEKREQSVQYFLITYASFAVAINSIIFVILVVVFKDGFAVLDSSYFILAFAAKYLLFAIILAVLLPLLFEYLKQNISLKISVKQITGKKEDTK
jgi:hypothetical protein